jgi:hypothetical protein
VLAAVRAGAITVEESLPPLRNFRGGLPRLAEAFEIHGLPDLRTTRIQQYR